MISCRDSPLEMVVSAGKMADLQRVGMLPSLGELFHIPFTAGKTADYFPGDNIFLLPGDILFVLYVVYYMLALPKSICTTR